MSNPAVMKTRKHLRLLRQTSLVSAWYAYGMLKIRHLHVLVLSSKGGLEASPATTTHQASPVAAWVIRQADLRRHGTAPSPLIARQMLHLVRHLGAAAHDRCFGDRGQGVCCFTRQLIRVHGIIDVPCEGLHPKRDQLPLHDHVCIINKQSGYNH